VSRDVLTHERTGRIPEPPERGKIMENADATPVGKLTWEEQSNLIRFKDVVEAGRAAGLWDVVGHTAVGGRWPGVIVQNNGRLFRLKGELSQGKITADAHPVKRPNGSYVTAWDVLERGETLPKPAHTSLCARTSEAIARDLARRVVHNATWASFIDRMTGRAKADKEYADQTAESLHMASRELRGRDANEVELAARAVNLGCCRVTAAGKTLSLQADGLTASQFRALVTALRWCGAIPAAPK
jgi:hypothetical protein